MLRCIHRCECCNDNHQWHFVLDQAKVATLSSDSILLIIPHNFQELVLCPSNYYYSFHYVYTVVVQHYWCLFVCLSVDMMFTVVVLFCCEK
jgi:hypothetical protein